MLKDEYNKYAGSRNRSRKHGYFKGIMFDPADWISIKELNDELQVSFLILSFS